MVERKEVTVLRTADFSGSIVRVTNALVFELGSRLLRDWYCMAPCSIWRSRRGEKGQRRRRIVSAITAEHRNN